MNIFYKKAMLSVLLLLCSMLGYSYDFNVDGIYYNVTSLTDLEAEVTYATSDYNNYSGNIIVPSTVTYNSRTFNVIGIGDYAFYNCTNLTSIVLPDGLTSIGAYAFYGCTALTSIDLHDGLTSIGAYAFYGCAALTSIDLHDGLTSIGAYAFYGWTGVTSFEIPENITSIGDYSFACCTG